MICICKLYKSWRAHIAPPEMAAAAANEAAFVGLPLFFVVADGQDFFMDRIGGFGFRICCSNHSKTLCSNQRAFFPIQIGGGRRSGARDKSFFTVPWDFFRRKERSLQSKVLKEVEIFSIAQAFATPIEGHIVKSCARLV